MEFVVVDLETTGTNPDLDAITEIGAVRVVGGEVVEEFQTFVNPEREIPAYIARLTGISNHMVKDAPSADAVIPMFLEFTRTSVLVAHNARFDVGFLKAAALRLGYGWPRLDVVDTLTLARRTFGRDEVKNHKLSTLAGAVGATTVPNHRALSDARATVDVLHAILARLAGQGVSRLGDLTGPHLQASPAQVQKRHLAADIPARPGVYSFVDAEGQAMYVGKSRNLRSRVRTYFTPQEKRRAVLDIIPATERIEVVECASDTEASIRELRLISSQKPRANRQGIRPSTGTWLRLGAGHEGLRMARVVKSEADGSAYLGPLRSRHEAEPIRTLLYSTLGSGAAELDPGSLGPVGPGEADGFHAAMRRAMTSDPSEVFAEVARRMRALAARGQFENAAALKERTDMFVRAAARAAALRSIAEVPLIVAAQRTAATGERAGWAWEVMAVRHGRLGAVRRLKSWEDPLRLRGALAEESAAEAQFAAPLAFGYHQEAELLLAWLGMEGTRIVHVEGQWAMPAGAGFSLEALTAHFSRTPAPISVHDAGGGALDAGGGG